MYTLISVEMQLSLTFGLTQHHAVEISREVTSQQRLPTPNRIFYDIDMKRVIYQ